MQIIQEGSVIAGHRIDSVAGRGGMGIVYRATHLRLERSVALKVVNPMFADDESFAERFQRESRVAASLRHPHIVTVHDAGEDLGLLYITMEFVEGTDMRKMINEGGALTPKVVATMISQTASALDAAHSRGLVHRDVKPANILVADDGGEPHAYLTDFGLTRHASSIGGLTGTGQWVGTIDYVAPEQVEGRGVDGRADVYALATVLFEAVSGELPFTQEGDLAKMYARLNGDPPHLRDRFPEFNRELDEVIWRGMARSPDQRYGSAGELAAAAAKALQSARELRTTQKAAPTTQVGRGPPAEPPPPATSGTRPMPDPEPASAAGLTEVPSGPAPHRVPIRGRLVALGAVIAVLAAAAGFAIAAVSDGGEGGETVEEGLVRLHYGDQWDRDVTGGRPIEGLQLEDPVALDYAALEGAGILRAGTVDSPAPGPDPLPAALADRFRRAPRPEPVLVNGLEGLHYRALTNQRGADAPQLDLMMVPTESGYVAVACEAPTADFQAFVAACDDVQGTLELLGTDPVGVSTDEELVSLLESTLTDTDEAQSGAEAGLDSNKAADQENAAQSVSDAYAEAARDLRKFDARPQDAAAVRQLEQAFEDSSKAFSALAAAAGVEDNGAYEAASERVANAAADTEAALKRLAASGYRLDQK